MKPVDPLVRTLRTGTVGGALCCFWLILQFIHRIFTGQIFSINGENLLYWLLALLYLLVWYVVIKRWRFIFRLARKRRLAVSHQADFPTVELTESQMLTMISPSRLIQRLNKRLPIIVTVFLTAIILGFIWIYVLVFNLPSKVDLSFTLIALAIASLFIIGLMIIFFFMSGMRNEGMQSITLTDEDITVRSGDGQVHSLQWHEIQLFATYRLFSSFGFRKKGSLAYEVSSAHLVVRWVQASEQQLLSGSILTEPEMTVEQYQRYMQMICAVIAHKTGLPLYAFDEKKS